MFLGDFYGPVNIMRSVSYNLLSTSCLSWVGRPEKAFYCSVFGCFGKGCLSLFSLCSLAVGAVQEILVFFWSDRLIFVTPRNSLSDEENHDCIMTKHDLSTQPLSTSLNVTQYLLWKLQLKAIRPFFVSLFLRIFLSQRCCDALVLFNGCRLRLVSICGCLTKLIVFCINRVCSDWLNYLCRKECVCKC